MSNDKKNYKIIDNDKNRKIKNIKEGKSSNKTNKNNKSTKSTKSKLSFYFKIVIFIILGAFLYFAVASMSSTNKGSVFQRLDILKQNKVPYLVVIRDDFSPVSDENKKLIDNIIKKTDESLTVFDISYNPKEISKESRYFIDKFDIESLPVVILCDEKGDLINSYYLPLNEKQILGSVEKARESSVN